MESSMDQKSAFRMRWCMVTYVPDLNKNIILEAVGIGQLCLVAGFSAVRGPAPLLSLVKGARNGIVYGSKVRFPHALVYVGPRTARV
jgi:hypothetical protein